MKQRLFRYANTERIHHQRPTHKKGQKSWRQQEHCNGLDCVIMPHGTEELNLSFISF